VAWLNAFATTLWNTTVVAVRYTAAVVSTLAMIAIFLLGKHLYGAQAGFRAVLAILATPGSCALGLLMTIDVPFICCWCWALYTLWRAIESRHRAGGWWILSGILVGLGLLSKQTMLAFPVLMFLFLLVSPQDRQVLRRPGPYLMGAVAETFLVPVLWWNIRHEWITVQHTAGHFGAHARSWWSAVLTCLEFIGSQALIFSPITWGLFVVIALVYLSRLATLQRSTRYLLIFSIVPFLGILGLSVFQRVNANWPAFVYPAGFILLAGTVDGDRVTISRMPWIRRWFRYGIGVGVGMAMLTYLLPLVLMGLRLDGSALDPTVRLKGWKQLGQEVEAVLKESREVPLKFLVTTSRQVASELAFYVPSRPVVSTWPSNGGRIRNQYDLWKRPSANIGQNGLLILRAGEIVPPDMAAYFEAIRPLKTLTIPLSPSKSRQYALYLGHRLKGWPSFPLAGRSTGLSSLPEGM
jgi:4-amino-4-deoxy-L-arabinose transferase-like glycosyltransferase